MQSSRAKPAAAEGLRRAVGPGLMRLASLYWRFARGITLGVRGMVLTEDEQVFLVRHSYIPGWHMPGGGVEPGETVREALARELAEEGNIALSGEPDLYGLYLNRTLWGRDHVALFVVRSFRQSAPPTPNAEIVEHGFFPCRALPPDTSPSTHQRIAEVMFGAPVSAEW